MTTPVTIECTVAFSTRQTRGRPKVHSSVARVAGRVPRLARLMALAIRFEHLLHTSQIADFAMLARSFGLYGDGPVLDPDQIRPALARALEVVRGGRLALVDTITQPR